MKLLIVGLLSIGMLLAPMQDVAQQSPSREASPSLVAVRDIATSYHIEAINAAVDHKLTAAHLLNAVTAAKIHFAVADAEGQTAAFQEYLTGALEHGAPPVDRAALHAMWVNLSAKGMKLPERFFVRTIVDGYHRALPDDIDQLSAPGGVANALSRGINTLETRAASFQKMSGDRRSGHYQKVMPFNCEVMAAELAVVAAIAAKFGDYGYAVGIFLSLLVVICVADGPGVNFDQCPECTAQVWSPRKDG